MLLTDQAVDYPLGQFTPVSGGLNASQLDRLLDAINDGYLALSDLQSQPMTPAMRSLRYALMSASVCAEAVRQETVDA